MSERKLFQKVVTEQKVVDAIKAGCQTSRDVADTLKVHHVTIQTKLLEMHGAGYLTRRKIGQTYIYLVADGVVIPEDTTEEDKAELARKIKEAKQTKAKAEKMMHEFCEIIKDANEEMRTAEEDEKEAQKQLKAEEEKKMKDAADTLQSTKGSGRCRILRAHKAAVGDDPERLTTDDILRLMRDDSNDEDQPEDEEPDFFRKIKAAKRK